MRFLLLFIATYSLGRADALSDLKTTLAKFGGTEAVRAKVTHTVSSSNKAADEDSHHADDSVAAVVVEDGAAGLGIFWSRETVAKAAAEAEEGAKTERVRRAMNALNGTTLNDLLNAGPRIARILDDAVLTGETSEMREGKPARRLTLKLTPKIDARNRKYIKELTATANVWVDAEGVPFAAETQLQTSGRAFLVFTFKVNESERFEFGRAGDRLLVTKQAKDSQNEGTGGSSRQKTETLVEVL